MDRLVSAMALAAVILFAPAAGRAYAQPAVAESPAARAAAALVSAVNADADARAAAVSKVYASTALAAEPASARLAFLDRLAADSGGLETVSLRAEGDRMAEAIVATHGGGRFARVVVFTSAKEPGKVTSLFVFPARDPAKAAREAWPTAPIPAGRLHRELGWRLDSLSREDSFSGVVLVADGDSIVFRRAYGMAEQAWRAPNRSDTAFHAGSVTKMFTAAAILKLAEQGRLSLDDTLARWVPEYPHRSAAERMTLRQLLSHTSGLGPQDEQNVRARTTAEAVRAMTARPTEEPGARFRYSNAGYVLLGAVLESVTGESFDVALKRLVLDPVGMTRTAAWPVTAIVENRATGYLRPEDDILGAGPRYANHQFLGFKGDGSGGLYTTADDLLAFHRDARWPPDRDRAVELRCDRGAGGAGHLRRRLAPVRRRRPAARWSPSGLRPPSLEARPQRPQLGKAAAFERAP